MFTAVDSLLRRTGNHACRWYALSEMRISAKIPFYLHENVSARARSALQPPASRFRLAARAAGSDRELSLRGYDVVAHRRASPTKGNPEPLVRPRKGEILRARARTANSREGGEGQRGGEGDCTMGRAIWMGLPAELGFRAKLNMKLRDRSGWPSALPSQEIRRPRIEFGMRVPRPSALSNA